MRRERYQPVDPTLSCYHRGVAEMRVEGELRAHLACMVLTMVGGVPWPWYVVVWPDGHKELSEEDYGPEWWTVREWDAGHFTYWEHPGTTVHRRFLGTSYVQKGNEITYQVTWLPTDEAAARWQQLGLKDTDF